MQPLLIERAETPDEAGLVASVERALSRGAGERAWLMLAFDDQVEPERWQGPAAKAARRRIKASVRALQPPFARIFAVGLSGQRYFAL